MLKILIYIIVLAPALYYGVYMFNNYRKSSLEIGLVGLVIGTFLIIIGVYNYPAEEIEVAIFLGLVFVAISAGVKLFEKQHIATKKVAKTSKEETLKKYNELIDKYGSLEFRSERPMSEQEIAKVLKSKKIGNIVAGVTALLFLGGAIAVHLLVDNSVFWVLIAGFVICVIGVLINNYSTNRKLEESTIYILKGVVTNKCLDKIGNNSYNYQLTVNKSIYIVTSKKLYKSLGFGFIIKAESMDQNFHDSYTIEVLGSIMTEEHPDQILLS